MGTTVDRRVFVCTIKKSIKRSTWQIKDGPSHELVPMHGVQRQLDAAVAALGGDNQDPHAVWDFIFSAAPLAEATIELEWAETRGEMVFYRFLSGPATTEGSLGWLPGRLFEPWDGPVAKLWVRLAPTVSDRPILLSPYRTL